jgi:RpiB/LacA/LacB family sugar-phosphate isomerase
VQDFGTHGPESVDYPDFGRQVSQQVSNGDADRGILICTTGIGMSILANKYPGVRAALVQDLEAARTSREHNDANILVLGGRRATLRSHAIFWKSGSTPPLLVAGTNGVSIKSSKLSGI